MGLGLIVEGRGPIIEGPSLVFDSPDPKKEVGPIGRLGFTGWDPIFAGGGSGFSGCDLCPTTEAKLLRKVTETATFRTLQGLGACSHHHLKYWEKILHFPQ